MDMKSTSPSQLKGVYIIVSIQVYQRVLHKSQAKKTLNYSKAKYSPLGLMVKIMSLSVKSV